MTYAAQEKKGVPGRPWQAGSRDHGRSTGLLAHGFYASDSGVHTRAYRYAPRHRFRSGASDWVPSGRVSDARAFNRCVVGRSRLTFLAGEAHALSSVGKRQPGSALAGRVPGPRTNKGRPCCHVRIHARSRAILDMPPCLSARGSFCLGPVRESLGRSRLQPLHRSRRRR